MTPEALIQSGIIHALYENGYIAFPAEFRGQRGCPDLVVFHEYLPDVAWLEVKTEDGTLNENQKLIHKVMRRCKQHVGVVRSIEEALNFVKAVFYG